MTVHEEGESFYRSIPQARNLRSAADHRWTVLSFNPLNFNSSGDTIRSRVQPCKLKPLRSNQAASQIVWLRSCLLRVATPAALEEGFSNALLLPRVPMSVARPVTHTFVALHSFLTIPRQDAKRSKTLREVHEEDGG